MPHYKPKYLENLDTSVEVELPISLYDFVRTIAEHNKQSMSEVCIEMLGSAQFNEHWFAEMRKGVHTTLVMRVVDRKGSKRHQR